MAALNAEIDPRLKKRLKTYALNSDVPLKQIVTDAIEQWLGKHESEGGSTTSSGESALSKQPSTGNVPTSNTAGVRIESEQIAEGDLPWVQKLLRVLHSPRESLRVAIQNNLNEFVWVAELHDELERQGQRSQIPAHASGAGKLRTPSNPNSRNSEDQRRGAQFPGAGEDPVETVDALEKTQEELLAGEVEAPGKPRKRRKG